MQAMSLLANAGRAAQSAVRSAPGPADGGIDRNAVRKRAVEFEAVYLAQMLQPMFDGLKDAAPFGGGFGEDVWRSQQVQEFGKAIAQRGGIGLADQVAHELMRAQEARQETGR